MEGEFELAFEIVKFSKPYHPFCNVSKSAVYMSNVLCCLFFKCKINVYF